MKVKRILKQNLSTVICAAVLFAPVQPFCHAEDTAATSAASRTVELNIKKGTSLTMVCSSIFTHLYFIKRKDIQYR